MSETVMESPGIPILKSVRRTRDFNPSDRLPFSSLMAGGGLIEVGQFGLKGASKEGKGLLLNSKKAI